MFLVADSFNDILNMRDAKAHLSNWRMSMLNKIGIYHVHVVQAQPILFFYRALPAVDITLLSSGNCQLIVFNVFCHY